MQNHLQVFLLADCRLVTTPRAAWVDTLQIQPGFSSTGTCSPSRPSQAPTNQRRGLTTYHRVRWWLCTRVAVHAVQHAARKNAARFCYLCRGCLGPCTTRTGLGMLRTTVPTRPLHEVFGNTLPYAANCHLMNTSKTISRRHHQPGHLMPLAACEIDHSLMFALWAHCNAR
jgi:hypothetical protein